MHKKKKKPEKLQNDNFYVFEAKTCSYDVTADTNFIWLCGVSVLRHTSL